MAKVTIEKIVRKDIETKYGTRQSIGIKPTTETVEDINGDEVALDGRWINGFKDKGGESDKWEDGMTIKVQIATKKYTRKDGTEGEAVNFKVPEDVDTVVEEAGVPDPEDF